MNLEKYPHIEPIPLPYTTLEPYISMEALNYHYTFHHHGYYEKILAQNPAHQQKSLGELMLNPSTQQNAKQIWNHNFFWESMSLEQNESYKTKILNLYPGFLDELFTQAMSVFGSGWVWFVYENGLLKFEKTSNEHQPTGEPLFVLDLWEHSYYIDCRGQRKTYVTNVINHLINWEFIYNNYTNMLGEKVN